MNITFVAAMKRVLTGVAVTKAGAASAAPVEDGCAAYESGDYARALKYFRLGAEQGNAMAQTSLGVMHKEGQGVPQDYSKAVSLFRLAANQGDASAQFNLGMMYDDGQGVPQDYSEAVKWYHLAADQGDSNAQNELGILYAKGLGVPQDYVLAHKWFSLSADQGHGAAVENRDRAAGLLTSHQLADALRLALDWKPTPN